MREYLRECLRDAPEFLILDASGQDASGRRRHGLLTGTRLTQPARPFTALRGLDSASDAAQIEVPFSASGRTTTVECWAASTNLAAGKPLMTSRTVPSSLVSFDMGVGQQPVTGSGTGTFWCGVHTDNTFRGKQTNANYADGRWHHFVARWDQPGGGEVDPNLMGLFIDAVLDSATTAQLTGSYTGEQTGSNNYGVFGSSVGARMASTVGCLWAWYPTALSDERIRAHYRAAVAGGIPAALAARSRMR